MFHIRTSKLLNKKVYIYGAPSISNISDSYCTRETEEHAVVNFDWLISNDCFAKVNVFVTEIVHISHRKSISHSHNWELFTLEYKIVKKESLPTMFVHKQLNFN